MESPTPGPDLLSMQGDVALKNINYLLANYRFLCDKCPKMIPIGKGTLPAFGPLFISVQQKVATKERMAEWNLIVLVQKPSFAYSKLVIHTLGKLHKYKLPIQETKFGMLHTWAANKLQDVKIGRLLTKEIDFENGSRRGGLRHPRPNDLYIPVKGERVFRCGHVHLYASSENVSEPNNRKRRQLCLTALLSQLCAWCCLQIEVEQMKFSERSPTKNDFSAKDLQCKRASTGDSPECYRSICQNLD